MLFTSDAYHTKATKCRNLGRNSFIQSQSLPLEESPRQSRFDKDGSVSELILSSASWYSDPLVRPIVSQLAKDDQARWLTLVLADKSSKTIHWLKSCGLNGDKIQILHPGSSRQSIELTKRALASGTSHTVISWLNDLDSHSLVELETAARNGQCQGLAIRCRHAA